MIHSIEITVINLFRPYELYDVHTFKRGINAKVLFSAYKGPDDSYMYKIFTKFKDCFSLERVFMKIFFKETSYSRPYCLGISKGF